MPDTIGTMDEGAAVAPVHFSDSDLSTFLELDKVVPSAAQPRDDATGKFVPKDTVLDTSGAEVLVDTAKGVDVSKDVQPAAELASAPAEGTEVPKEGAVQETPATPAEPSEATKPPLTKFQIFDKDGELEVPTDLNLRYKVDKQMVDVPLEKVVHLAQQSTFNARQVQLLAEQSQERMTEIAKREQAIQEYEAFYGRVLTDDAFRAAAAERYAAATSPEARAEAAEQRVQQLQAAEAFRQESGQVAQFTTGTIEPAMEHLATTYPHVTQDDLLGRLALVMPAFLVNGRVPLANLPKVQSFVETDLAQWAKAVHEQRAGAIHSATKSTTQEKAALQAKQRQIGKALSPVGGPAGAAPAKAAPVVTSANDVFDDPMFGGKEG